MTNENVIKAAFKVWGRDLYQTMSLSAVAGDLGVSKTALYRHFRCKQALFDSMSNYFFDELTAYIKDDYEKALSAENLAESSFILIRAVSKYYLLNEDAFIFSLFQIFGSRQIGKFMSGIVSRGIDPEKLISKAKKPFNDPARLPFIMHIVIVSVIFWIGQFHHFERKNKIPPGEKEILKFISVVEDRIKRGIGFDKEKTVNLDYVRLEKIAAETLPLDTEDNVLLRAVAGAVAEAGPTRASVKMIAARSGLAKSSLYSHFRDKQDMLDTLFLTEFTRIASYARDNINASIIPEEQIYLGMASIAAYLQSRPDILAILDWLRSQRVRPSPRLAAESQKVIPLIYRIITDIDLPGMENDAEKKDRIAQWVLFLTVKGLIWRLETSGKKNENLPGFPGKGKASGFSVAPENIRVLYRFIALGLEGFLI